MDAKTYAEHVKRCSLCNRKGGLILLTRYALASRDSNAPEVSEDFKVTQDGSASVALDEDTLYTQRLLDAGFVYVYDPENARSSMHRSPWQGYTSDNLGFLIPFPVPTPRDYAFSPPDRCTVPCDPWANEMVARCISVPNPDKPRTIWIGFSRTRWTQAVFKENEKEHVRDSHMRRFDLAKWWREGRHEHACSMGECDRHITEMATSIKRGSFDFSHAPLEMTRPRHNTAAMAKFVSEEPRYPATDTREAELIKKTSARPGGQEILRQARSFPKESLLRAAERQLGAENKHKAAVVALDDPAGVLMDLNVYMDFQLQRYLDEILAPNTKLGREITIAGIIENMKEGIGNDILRRCEGQARGGSFLLRYHTQDYFKQIYKKFLDDPDALEESAKRHWLKYDAKIDWDKLNASKVVFQNLLIAYDRAHTLPLAKAYVAWFNSPKFYNHMSYNHDPDDVDSGEAYATLTSHCLGSVQNKTPVLEEVIIKQLQDSVEDRTKVLARALI